MATLFIDFENGNDNYAGTSFALLAQGTDGAIVTATFTSVTASFPNDGSLIGQYLSIFNGTIYAVYNITAWVSATSLTIAAISGGTALANTAARQYYIGGRWKNITTGATAVRTIPGDTIRMMGSPAPTSLGQTAVWTSQALQAPKVITSIASATPASVTSTAHGYSTGDTIVITGTTNDNYNATFEITVTGVNTFTLNGSVADGASTGGTARLRNNTRVLLTTALTQTIASTGPSSTTGSGRRIWTASSSVTCGFGVGKEGRSSDNINIAAGFTTGLAAYWPTPSSLDLSGYQQVSFWIQQTSGTIGAAGAIDLRLCSDTAGVTAVNTISIPNLAVAGRWMPVTVDLGTNLGSSIQSIALYINTDNGAQVFQVNNIIACKASSAADSLTLTSLIGKNTTGETFWGIQSINGTRVMLDSETNALPTSTSVRGYYGTSETVTTWKRETIKLGPAATSATALQTVQESGTDSNFIAYSGGWDRTAMSTQTLDTWLDGVNGFGAGITTDVSFVRLLKIAGSRFNTFLSFGANSFAASTENISGNNNSTTAVSLSGRLHSISANHIVANNFGIFSSDAQSFKDIVIQYASYSNSTSGATVVPAINSQVKIAASSNSAQGMGVNGSSNGGIVYDSSFTDNTIDVSMSGLAGAISYRNCFFGSSNELSFVTANTGNIVSSQNHDQTANNHKIFITGALISSATDQRHTASGISWKIQPTSANRSSVWPVTFSLAKVACSANNLVTIKAWMYRDNAGLTMRLVCKGGQLAGVASDVTASVTTTNAWEEETITFTPTETGVVEITAEAWGGTTFSGWVDDMTISQA